MRDLISILILVFLPSVLFSQPLQHQKDGVKFRVGIYGLQGGNNNSDISDQIDSAFNGSTQSQFEAINITIPYYTWYRATYPNFTGFNDWTTDYMEEVFENTNENGIARLQTISTWLYPSFVDPAFVLNDPQVGNDALNDRTLNLTLFDSYINALLQKEFDLVSQAVNGDGNQIRNILSDKDKRPLGGWYLDDEPLVRNHDVQVINEMGTRIRTLENNFRSNNSVLSSLSTTAYQQRRYIAFDANDLHDHHTSENPGSGNTYNEDGMTKNITESNRYTIFGQNVDVVMPDFYDHDHDFWSIIIKQIRKEYNDNSMTQPEIIPIIFGYKNDNTHWFSESEYTRLRDDLISQDVDGLFLFKWNNYDCCGNNLQGARALWADGYSNISKVLEDIESFTIDGKKDDLGMLYNQNAGAQRTSVILSDGDSFRDKNWADISSPFYSYWMSHPNTTYNFDQVKFVTSGDFNGDGRDDLVMLYDQNTGAQRTSVILSDGDSFRDKNWTEITSPFYSYWLSQPKTGFNFDNVKFVTSGDFNGDGHDDLAMFYDQNSGAQRTIVMLSDGDSFRDRYWNEISDAKTSYWMSHPSSTYNFDNVKFVTSGDFNGDGQDDLVLLYDQNVGAQRITVLLSGGTVFKNSNGDTLTSPFYSYWLSQPKTGFNFDNVKFVTSGDYNGDGRDDLAMFYDQNSGAQRTIVMLSDGNSFRDKYWNEISDAKTSYWLSQPSTEFNFDQVKFVSSGDYNGDGRDDLAMLYDQNSGAQRTIVMLSDGDSFRDKYWNEISDAKTSYWMSHTNSTYNFDQVKFVASGDFHSPITKTQNSKVIGKRPQVDDVIWKGLHGNYPNPFNPQTQIYYSLENRSPVSLKVYDILGREVRVLINNQIKEKGSHQILFNGASLPSGTFFYILKIGDESRTGKMILLK